MVRTRWDGRDGVVRREGEQLKYEVMVEVRRPGAPETRGTRDLSVAYMRPVDGMIDCSIFIVGGATRELSVRRVRSSISLTAESQLQNERVKRRPELIQW